MTLQTRDDSIWCAPVRSLGRSLVMAMLVSLVVSSIVLVGDTVDAAPAGDDEVIAFEVRGVGNGHGRGLSQWGAYGRALAGQSWQEILGAYYGGTRSGTRSEPHMRVRLTGWDASGTVGVISTGRTARWNSNTTNYRSLYAVETSSNRFSVFGSTSGSGCPGASTLTIPFVDLQLGSTGPDVADMQGFLNQFGFAAGTVDGQFGPTTKGAVERFQVDAGFTDDGLWRTEEATRAQAMVDAGPPTITFQQLATNVTGPIRFSTTADQSTAAAGSVLGLCKASGGVTHYRGSIELVNTTVGNRVVNDVDVENYLRGVLPKEVPPSWGDAGGGAGMNALRAQAVAARSFGMSQGRYSYAGTCDTSSCQVYGGAATRVSATSSASTRLETDNTDDAIDDTGGVVRLWPGGQVVSTEFSASNGPRTAGGAFPSVDDPWDDVAGNPNHRWTRVIDADSIRSRYGLSTANGVRTRVDADSPYEGIWANEVALGNGSTVSAWSFRNAFGLRAPGFELVPIRRDVTGAVDFVLIGDSVGVSVAGTSTSELPVVTEGMFSTAEFDVLGGRRTQGGSLEDGVTAARRVPLGTDLVVVELGYNDEPAAMAGRIDAVMAALRDRGVGLVLWVDVSERRTSPYEVTNAALRAAAQRWDELAVLGWNEASDHTVADRWYADGVHLTSTGQAEFALWLRRQVLDVVANGYTPPRPIAPGEVLRVPVMGRAGVPADGAGSDVVGVALNVTAVDPVGPGFLRVWPCGSAKPETSSVNYLAGGVEPNAVVVPVDATGEVCVSSLVTSDVVVDVSGWFDAGVRSGVGRLVDTRDGAR